MVRATGTSNDALYVTSCAGLSYVYCFARVLLTKQQSLAGFFLEGIIMLFTSPCLLTAAVFTLVYSLSRSLSLQYTIQCNTKQIMATGLDGQQYWRHVAQQNGLFPCRLSIPLLFIGRAHGMQRHWLAAHFLEFAIA